MKSNIRIGIIGTGWIARNHIEQYKNTPGVQIVGGADIVPGKAAAFFQEYGLPQAKAYLDYHELLEQDLDAVSVCTYNMAHFQPTVDALNAGCDVLLEKPMSVTLVEATGMVRTAQQTGKILSIGFQSRYAPALVKAREIVQSGALGKIYYVETGGGRRAGIPGGTFNSKTTAGGGSVLDIGCYSLDTAMYVLGHPKPLTVSAFLSDYFCTARIPSKLGSWGGPHLEKIDVDDFGTALVRLEGGIALMFKISWAMHMDTLGPALWLGTEGGLKMDKGVQLYHDQAGVGAQTDLEIPKAGQSPWQQKIGRFVQAVRERESAPIPAEEVLYTQAILDGIYRSAAAGREVTIELPSDISLPATA